MPGCEMVPLVPGHRCAVLGHQRPLLTLAVEQKLRIGRAEGWHAWHADAEDIKLVVVAPRLLHVVAGKVLVNKEADLHVRVSCCAWRSARNLHNRSTSGGGLASLRAMSSAIKAST